MDTDTLLEQFAKRVQYWNDFFGMTASDMQFAVAYREDLEKETPAVTYQHKITTLTIGPKALEWEDREMDLTAFTCVFTVFTTVVNGYGLAHFHGDMYRDSDTYKEFTARYTALRLRLLRIAQLFVWPVVASGQGDENIAELVRRVDDETTGSD